MNFHETKLMVHLINFLPKAGRCDADVDLIREGELKMQNAKGK